MLIVAELDVGLCQCERGLKRCAIIYADGTLWWYVLPHFI